MTDDELLRGLRQHDPGALEALADAHAAPIYALCHRVLAGVGTAQDVEEATCDVLYRAWERAGQYDPERGPDRLGVPGSKRRTERLEPSPQRNDRAD